MQDESAENRDIENDRDRRRSADPDRDDVVPGRRRPDRLGRRSGASGESERGSARDRGAPRVCQRCGRGRHRGPAVPDPKAAPSTERGCRRCSTPGDGHAGAAARATHDHPAARPPGGQLRAPNDRGSCQPPASRVRASVAGATAATATSTAVARAVRSRASRPRAEAEAVEGAPSFRGAGGATRGADRRGGRGVLSRAERHPGRARVTAELEDVIASALP